MYIHMYKSEPMEVYARVEVEQSNVKRRAVMPRHSFELLNLSFPGDYLECFQALSKLLGVLSGRQVLRPCM